MSATARWEGKSLFVEDLRMTDLRFGASFLIWGFRHCAAGAAHCSVARRSYAMAFEGDEQALAHLELLTTAIRDSGQRRIWFAPPACEQLTLDEACLLEALEAAQTEQFEQLNARLGELLASAPSELVRRCAHTLAHTFRARGFLIVAPGEHPSSQERGLANGPQSHMIH
ncbi:MAG: hypothetical protein AAGA68_11860 [Pseudomonadota bacterium]